MLFQTFMTIFMMLLHHFHNSMEKSDEFIVQNVSFCVSWKKVMLQVWSDMRMSYDRILGCNIPLLTLKREDNVVQKGLCQFWSPRVKGSQVKCHDEFIHWETVTAWTITTVVKVTAISDKTAVGIQNTEALTVICEKPNTNTLQEKLTLKRIKGTR